MMATIPVLRCSLTSFFGVFLILLTFNTALHAAGEIDHPFFQSEAFKHFTAEYNQSAAEIERLQNAQQRLLKERTSYDFFGGGLLNAQFRFFSINQIIALSLASLVLIMLYLFCLKRFNPAKWYILFKSKRNFALLCMSMKQANKIGPLLCLTTLLCPGLCYAGSTSLFEDVKLFLSNDAIKRNYVLTKYPKRVNTLPYNNVKDIFVYKNFEEGSFEQNYNFHVHKYAIGVGVEAADLVRLIETCRTLAHLTTSYAFIFSLDDDLLRTAVSSRLAELAPFQTSMEFKLKEAEIILDKAKATKKTVLIQDALLSLLKHLIANVPNTDVGNILTLAALMLEFDLEQSLELYTKVRYSFETIFSTEQHQERFRKVFTTLSRTYDINKLYDLRELRARMEQYSDRAKVLLGIFFDSTNEQVADLIVKTIPLDNVTFANMPEMEHLATLVKKYRPGDTKTLYEGLVSEYCRTGQVSILSLARVAAALGYDREQLVDDSIRTDLAMHAQQEGRSTLVTQEFLDFLSDSQLERYMDYLQRRPQHAKRILDSLNTRKYALFLDYLNFMYLTYPTRIADATFANTLVRFDRWTHVISSSTLARFSELPFAYFLADREVTMPIPDMRKLRDLIDKRLEHVWRMVIRNEAKLDEADWVHALILYYIVRKASDPHIKDMSSSLEDIIRRQLVDTLDQQRVGQNDMLQRLRATIDSLQADVSMLRAAQYKLYIALCLLFVIAAYILLAFLYALKYALNAVLSYTGTRIALFVLVFVETMAKFLLPVLHCTIPALGIILVVQLYAFLRSKDGAYPNTIRALTFYQEFKEG